MRRLMWTAAVALAIACGGTEDGVLGVDSALRKCRDPNGCCGDGVLHPGETCDTGGVDTATCNGWTCTAPVCGDSYTNGAAGEACDTAGNSTTCNADCTLSSCGDSFTNPAAREQCDSGGVDTATCDGVTCTTRTCGDSYVNVAAGEQCDAGGNTATCDADCTPPACGDGILNLAAGEECETADGADVPGCSDCRLVACVQ